MAIWQDITRVEFDGLGVIRDCSVQIAVLKLCIAVFDVIGFRLAKGGGGDGQ